MALDLNGGSGFSQPLGASLYPPPPHHFRGAKRAFATYEADTERVSDPAAPRG